MNVYDSVVKGTQASRLILIEGERTSIINALMYSNVT